MPHLCSSMVNELMRKQRSLTDFGKAFENTSTNIAAAQMRNSLTGLAESVADPEQKKVSRHLALRLHHVANRTLSSSKPRWTTSLPCSDDTSTTRPRAALCKPLIPDYKPKYRREN